MSGRRPLANILRRLLIPGERRPHIGDCGVAESGRITTPVAPRIDCSTEKKGQLSAEGLGQQLASSH